MNATATTPNTRELAQRKGQATLIQKDRLSLKWGTLKSWKLHSTRGQDLMRTYVALGASMSAAMQKDSPTQKKIICDIIDECNADTIYLDWDGRDVSKDEAKKYVMEYGNESMASQTTPATKSTGG